MLTDLGVGPGPRRDGGRARSPLPTSIPPWPAAGHPGPASDVFGVAAAAFHALTGIAPWNAATPGDTLDVAADGLLPDLAELAPEAPGRAARGHRPGPGSRSAPPGLGGRVRAGPPARLPARAGAPAGRGRAGRGPAPHRPRTAHRADPPGAGAPAPPGTRGRSTGGQPGGALGGRPGVAARRRPPRRSAGVAVAACRGRRRRHSRSGWGCAGAERGRRRAPKPASHHRPAAASAAPTARTGERRRPGAAPRTARRSLRRQGSGGWSSRTCYGRRARGVRRRPSSRRSPGSTRRTAPAGGRRGARPGHGGRRGGAARLRAGRSSR